MIKDELDKKQKWLIRLSKKVKLYDFFLFSIPAKQEIELQFVNQSNTSKLLFLEQNENSNPELENQCLRPAIDCSGYFLGGRVSSYQPFKTYMEGLFQKKEPSSLKTFGSLSKQNLGSRA